MAQKGFWDDYNKKQKQIMEERIKAAQNKPYKEPAGPIVGNRVPGTPIKKPKK